MPPETGHERLLPRRPSEQPLHIITHEEREFYFREEDDGLARLLEYTDGDGEMCIRQNTREVTELPEAVIERVKKEGLTGPV